MGPLRHQWCMRYEMIHSFLKRRASILCNYRNMPLSLAVQYQYKLADNLLCKRFNRCFIEPGAVKPLRLERIESGFLCALQEFLRPGTAYLQSCREIVSNGQNYTVKQIVIANFDGHHGQKARFCEIRHILLLDGKWCFAVDVLKTRLYNNHLHAYEIGARRFRHILKIDELADYHPLNIYKRFGKLMVRLRYYVGNFL